jgi:hypothetical protein
MLLARPSLVKSNPEQAGNFILKKGRNYLPVDTAEYARRIESPSIKMKEPNSDL